jgi:hypothetical protein
VHRAHLVKTASHVASVKNECVNCANLWTPSLRSLPQPQLQPLKSVRLASHVKNVLRAHRVKNASHVPSKPLLPLPKKNWQPTKSNCRKTVRKAPKAIVHAAAPVASVVAATVASVNAMPTAT